MVFSTSCMPFQLIQSRRKASKCKKLIEELLYRLKLVRARKRVIVSQTRQDIFMLLGLGQSQLALKFVGELHREQNRLAGYEIIDELCKCISKNMSCISKKRELPVDANVAISSLIFAASRCGELPELNKLRKLFRKLYGSKFDASNANLSPSNLVKSELKKTLSSDPISDDMKLELMNEIIKNSSAPQTGQQVYDVSEEKAASMVQDEENPSARESPDSTDQIQEREIVYLDDMPRNKPPRHRRMPICSNISSIEPKRNRVITQCRGHASVNVTEPVHRTRKLCQGSQGETVNCIHHQKQKEDSSSCKGHRSHVHPNLPEYEDLQANLKRLGRSG